MANKTDLAPRHVRSGRPTVAQSADLTERIMRHSTELFLKKGFARTSMEEVALASGTSKRTLYSRFPTKELLFRENVRSYTNKKFGKLPIIGSSVASICDQLHEICISILEILLVPEIIAFEKMVIAESEHFPELIMEQQYAQQKVLEHLIVSIQVNVDNGRLQLTCKDVDTAARHIWNVAIAPIIRDVMIAISPSQLNQKIIDQVETNIKFGFFGIVMQSSVS